MRVALLTAFSASKKESPAVLLERIHAAFVASGQGEPFIRFSLCDAPLPGFVSSVDRVLKRYPRLARFVTESAMLPGNPPLRLITNGPASTAAGESVDFGTLLAIAAGVPRSFPFHNVSVHFHSPAFGEGVPLAGPTGGMTAGVMAGDSWWVNGRMRSLMAMTLVEGDPASKKLPSPPEPVAVVFAACGKQKSVVQVPLPGAAPPTPAVAENPEAARAVAAVVQEYRSQLAEIVNRAALPHDLPSDIEARQTTSLGETTGPKKPVLVRAFKPMGYDCTSDSGTFKLRRRTPGGLTVEISLDVGTWSRSLTSHYQVQGIGFRASLPLPVSKRAIAGGQYPIGVSERRQQLVDNMAALVKELDRSFVPAVETASGPSPEWYKPES